MERQENFWSVSVKNQAERALYRRRDEFRRETESNMATAKEQDRLEDLQERRRETQKSTEQAVLAADELIGRVLAHGVLTEAVLEALMQVQ